MRIVPGHGASTTSEHPGAVWNPNIQAKKLMQLKGFGVAETPPSFF
jgi:hypothetical protein